MSINLKTVIFVSVVKFLLRLKFARSPFEINLLLLPLQKNYNFHHHSVSRVQILKHLKYVSISGYLMWK